MQKIKLLFLINIINFQNRKIIADNKTIIEKIKNTGNYLLEKYKNLNEYKIFKYGKYILLIPVIYYPSKKLLIYEWNKLKNELTIPNNSFTIPFTDIEIDYPAKDYKYKEIAKYEIGNIILKELESTPKLKDEFLLYKPEIIIEKRNAIVEEISKIIFDFKINMGNFSKELRNKLYNIYICNISNFEKKIKDEFLEKLTKYEYIKEINTLESLKGRFSLDKNYNDKPIYEVEVENNLARIYQTKEFEKNKASILRCPVVAPEHGMINYYYQLKLNNNINLIESLYNNLGLLSKFLDEFTTNGKEISWLLINLISKCDLTEVLENEAEILNKKIINSFKNKNIKLDNKKNITDDDMNEQIQLVFDKLTNIFHIYNSDQTNILKHIGTVFVVKWIWQKFNFYLYEQNLPLLPSLKINAPIITPRFWCTLDPLNKNIHLKCLGGHFHFSYFTLDKDTANKTKKFIEEWVKKYYMKNPELWTNNFNDTKTTHFKVNLKEHNN